MALQFIPHLLHRLRGFPLDTCYFGDTHHAENKRGCRWADTETLRLTQRAEEMWGDMFRPLNVSSVHCQKLEKTNQRMSCLSYLSSNTSPACFSTNLSIFSFSETHNMGGKFMFKIRWLTGSFDYPCLTKLTGLDNHKRHKASLRAKGLSSLTTPCCAVVGVSLWGGQKEVLLQNISVHILHSQRSPFPSFIPDLGIK